MHPVHPHPQKGLRQHRTMKAAALCANRFCSMLRYCPGGMCMFSAFFRDLRTEFAGYNADKLLKDVMAGLTVCAVALPLALAFGVSSGASAAAGLVTAILAGVVIAILGGASYQVSGPTGAMSAVLIGIVAQYGLQGVFFACFAAGVLLLAAGLLKLGRLIGFIPMPVIMGFTSGIAIIIVVLCFNMCGDALRDALDPKLRGTLGSGKKTKRAKRTKNVKEVA